MFCRNCGAQIKEGARFCSECGTQVVTNIQEEHEASDVIYTEESSKEDVSKDENNTEYRDTKDEDINRFPIMEYEQQERNYSNFQSEEKLNWKEYVTLENIERFAPAAAIMPLAMAVVMFAYDKFLEPVVWLLPMRRILDDLIPFLLNSVFLVVTIGAAAGLINVALKKKDTSNVASWIVPMGTGLAALSCMGIAFDWDGFPFIAGIVSVLMGLEFISRIVIKGQPMESPFNPGEAFETYKSFYEEYKSKYSSGNDAKAEKTEISNVQRSEFDGSGIELFGYSILAGIVSVITCGIAAPWMIAKVTKWRLSHTVINGKRLTFTGTGGSLLGHWILWCLLTIVTCGIYGFFLMVSLRKWELSHTYIEGEHIVANGNESYFDGNSFTYFGYSLLSGILLLVTCGLAYPWVMAMMQKWDTKHQVINNRRLSFDGSGMGFLGEFLIIAFFTLITCGLYSSWGVVRMNKYIIRHTNFVS